MIFAKAEGVVALQPLVAVAPARLDPVDVVTVRVLVSVLLDSLDLPTNHLLDVVNIRLDRDFAENAHLLIEDLIRVLHVASGSGHLVLDLEVRKVALQGEQREIEMSTK